jgi:predicted metalloprotease with PDZ domain
MNARFLCFLSCLLLCLSVAFSATTSIVAQSKIKATLDLVSVKDDKVHVTLSAPASGAETLVFQMPRIIPGTYVVADYGRYVEKLTATDIDGKELVVEKKDVNTWIINNAERLQTVSYLVNDTYDSEEGNPFDGKSTTIFSPAGMNILADKNYMLNLFGFVGYFRGYTELPYELNITHPEDLYASTALIDEDANVGADRFTVTRYAEVVDNPIMYSVPDTVNFVVDGMEVLLSIYSPNNKQLTAEFFRKDIEQMVVAQKTFLGKINDTRKYAILVYIAASANDATGFGALEHNSSTTVVFGEFLKSENLVHVIAHEFFHTLTPLHIHSKEIHDFDFNDPSMSAHLWMYEGITEYFSHLFQVNQGLITEDIFFKTMASNEVVSKKYFKDNLSFTEMSKNILKPSYKEQYLNVYKKGALLGMCMDITLRKKSNGEKGILDLMGQLREIYGPYKAFDDAALIPKVTELAGKELGDFIQKHIVAGKPVKYTKYLQLVGVKKSVVRQPEEFVFLVNRQPHIKIDTSVKKVFVINTEQNNFFKALGVQVNDELLEINGAAFDASNYMSVIMLGMGLKEDSPMVLKVKRENEILELKGVVKLNYKITPGYEFKDSKKESLKNAWLKG